MNGKQALYDLIDEIKYTHNDGVSLTPFDQKRVDIIAKDLEVLKVLKGILKVYCVKRKRNNLYILASKNPSLTKEEYDLLKELWEDDE